MTNKTDFTKAWEQASIIGTPVREGQEGDYMCQIEVAGQTTKENNVAHSTSVLGAVKGAIKRAYE